MVFKSDMWMDMLTGAHVSLDRLRRLGVRTIFGCPGGAILPLYDELYHSDINHILVRHEQNAAHMADGYARTAKVPGVCVATSGPGATNLITGIATAYLDSSPVIAITGQVATGSIGRDAFQEVDAFDLFRPVTKQNWRIENMEEVDQVFKSAYEVSFSGRYGPVHIDFPIDVQKKDFSFPDNDVQPRQNFSDLRNLTSAVRILENTAAPVLLVGGGTKWERDNSHILRLAELLGAPIVTTLMGKGAVPENHPLALGTVGMHGKMVATYVLNNAETVVSIGSRFSDRSVSKPDNFGNEKNVIHIDVDNAEFNKNIKGVTPLFGNSKDVVIALTEALSKKELKDRTEWSRKINELKKSCACDYNLTSDPVKPQKIIFELNRNLEENAILVTDVGRHQMWAEHFFEVRNGREFMTSGGLGTMGFGLPGGMGAKVAAPNKPVYCLTGDGSFQMSFKELATAVENDIKVTVIVMNDGYLGMVTQWQNMFYGKRLSASKIGLVPDFVKMAEVLGCQGSVVNKSSELSEAIHAAQKSDVPYVIDVHVDPEEELAPFITPGTSYRESYLGKRCRWRFP